MEKIVKTCEFCGKDFEPKRESAKAKKKIRFCNHSCSASYFNQRETDHSERFWVKVDKTGDCWLWKGAMHSKKVRRGIFMIKGKKHVAYKVAFTLKNGITDFQGLFVCHKCNNPQCVRPEHLYLGTHQDNMNDRMAAGNYKVSEKRKVQMRGQNTGTENKTALFTYDQIENIWKLFLLGNTKTEISVAFNVSDTVICNIINGKTYRKESEAIKQLLQR